MKEASGFGHLPVQNYSYMELATVIVSFLPFPYNNKSRFCSIYMRDKRCHLKLFTPNVDFFLSGSYPTHGKHKCWTRSSPCAESKLKSPRDCLYLGLAVDFDSKNIRNTLVETQNLYFVCHQARSLAKVRVNHTK